MTGFFHHWLWRVRQALADPACCLCGKPVEVEAYSLCAPCEGQLWPVFSESAVLQPGQISGLFWWNASLRRLFYRYKFGKSPEPYQQLISHGLTTVLPQVRKTHSSLILSAIPARSGARRKLETLARESAWELGLPYHALLQWKTERPRQHQLKGREQRLRNMKGAFNCEPLAHLPENTAILVLDDLLTTGATLREALSTLRKAYPKAVVYGLAGGAVPKAGRAEQLASSLLGATHSQPGKALLQFGDITPLPVVEPNAPKP